MRSASENDEIKLLVDGKRFDEQYTITCAQEIWRIHYGAHRVRRKQRSDAGSNRNSSSFIGSLRKRCRTALDTAAATNAVDIDAVQKAAALRVGDSWGTIKLHELMFQRAKQKENIALLNRGVAPRFGVFCQRPS